MFLCINNYNIMNILGHYTEIYIYIYILKCIMYTLYNHYIWNKFNNRNIYICVCVCDNYYE